METHAPAPGTCYKFTVDSAHQAAQLIRERLGENARVLSVRTVEPSGLRGLWASPKLEVIAQVGAAATFEAPAGPAAAAPSILNAVSDEAASPVATPVAAPAAPRPSAEERRTRLPGPRNLSTLLRRSGLSETLVTRLESSPAWAALREMPLHQALVETGRHLRRFAETRREPSALVRAAFLGTPGVGRTTALCKWLASDVFRRGRMGHVILAEFDRPNSPGPLPVFCEALGVPLAHYPAATHPVTPGGFVYFDLPGISLRDPSANAPVAEFLEREKIEQRVLVLNAAYDHAALRAGYAAGRELGATHVVFTHLDEVTQWGRLWDYMLDGGLEPLFLATGPSLTGDAEEDVFESLVRRTLPGAGAPEAGSESERDDDRDETANAA